MMGEELAYRISGFEELDKTKICYWHTTGGWQIYLPGCGLGGLKLHTVVENEDGTITVSPSILITSYATEDGIRLGKPITRHGFLTKGVWREV
jgi:hypothetical protein